MNKQKMAVRTRFLPCLLVLWLVLVGCTPIRPGAGNSTDQAQAGGMTPGLALVDSIQVNQQEQVQVTVQGNLPDGCTELGEAAVVRTGEQVAVTLPTSRPADAFCTQAVVPFEETIMLDLSGLPAGEYVVNVNGVSEAFTLESDNTSVTPQATTNVSGTVPITVPITATTPTTATAIVTDSGPSSGELAIGVNYRNLTINLDGSFTSNAQLTFPAEGEGPWPTVILFAGSGPYDLDASYSPAPGQPVLSTNFRLLATRLGEAGIAVLRFNKRGVLSYGNYDAAQVQQANVNQLITDADSVLATAIAQAEVNPEQIFLYGWSEGAIVAANVAANHPELAGLILQAPPNGGLDETLNYQQQEVALPYLREAVDQNGDGQLSRDELSTIPPGPVWYTSLFYIWAPDASPTNPTFQEGLDTNGDELIDIDQELLPVMEARIPEIAEAYAAVSPTAAVADTVASLAMPILVLHGRQDGWVPFSNAETIAAAAPETVTIIIYPNLGHALSPSRTPATDAFGVIADRPVENVVDWIERGLE